MARTTHKDKSGGRGNHPRPKRRFSQNFLTDENMARQIVDLTRVEPGDTLIEVGPGTGALTRHLVERAAHVHAVEVDRELFAQLGVDFRDEPKLTLHSRDILKTEIEDLVPEGPVTVVGNLPYNITSDLVLWMLQRHRRIRRAVVLMQKEVAARLTAEPGQRAAGSLTLAVRYRAEAEVILEVPPGSFRPIPRVMSSLVVFRFLDEPAVHPADEAFFFRVIRASFGERRKTMANALSGGLGIPREAVAEVAEAVGIDPRTRGERLTLENFRVLADGLATHMKADAD